MRAYLYLFLVAAAVTYLTTPLVRRMARRIGAITPVRDRDVHAVPVPRMGGLAMFLGLVAALLVGSQTSFLGPLFTEQAPWGILLGAGVVCSLGVADDLWDLDAITKFAGQALAAGLMAWQGVQFVVLPIGGVTIPSFGMLFVVSVFVVVVTINAVNFVDGLDGLAAGIVGIAGSAFFVYSYLLARGANKEDFSSLASMITAIMVGCCVGFLPHNFNPARVFMGDAGSMLLGLLLACSTITITGKVDPAVLSELQIAPAFFPLLLPLVVLAVPLVDLAMAVIRRTRAGQKPWHPDKSHLHHRLLRLGHSHARAVLLFYLWTAIAAFGVALMAFVPVLTALALGTAGVIVALGITFGPWRRREVGGLGAPHPPVTSTVLGPAGSGSPSVDALPTTSGRAVAAGPVGEASGGTTGGVAGGTTGAGTGGQPLVSHQGPTARRTGHAR